MMRPVSVPKVGAELKTFAPEKVLLFASKVEEAAVIVMLPVPSKETLLMVRAVWSAVAVEALPVRAPCIPPEAVRTPVTVVEAAIVVDAAERRPFVKERVVEVAFPGNGYAKVA